MSNEVDPRLCWYIAVGNNFNWGRAQTEAEAIANMKREAGSRNKTTEYVVYRCSKGTYVNDMGGLNWPTIDGRPVEIKHIRPKEKVS